MAYGNGLPEQNITKDQKQSVFWLSKAAQAEAAEAQYNMAVYYFKDKSDGIKEGLEWLEKSAQQNYPMAQFELANIYSVGYKGVTKDEGEYVYWLERIVKEGSAWPNVYDNLSTSYFLGKGVKKDHKKALEYALKSADMESFYGLKDAGKYYSQGIGTKKDLVKGYMMYDLLGTAGEKYKKELEPEMTHEQIEAALKASWQWQRDHNSYRPSYGGGPLPL